MVTIIVENNICKLECHLKTLIKLRKLTRIKHPNGYFLRVKGKVQQGWDGFVYPITEGGKFETGLLPRIVDIIKKECKLDIEFIDERNGIVDYKVPYELGKYEPRGYQRDTVNAALNNYVEDLHFPRGIFFSATNAGKTLIAALTHASIPGAKTAFLLNQSDLYRDAKEEMPKFLGEDEVGWIQGKELKWGNFMICMVPTLKNRLNLIMNKLSTYNVVIFDECDTATSKTSGKVVKTFYNAPIKLGMSGSVGTHKDPLKNLNIHKMFGEIVYTIKNHELIEMGHSAKVRVEILEGNTKHRYPGDYKLEMEKGIVKNKTRNTTIINRVKEKAREDRLPLLIMTPTHKHIRILTKRLKEELGAVYRIESVHHKTKNRAQLQKEFAEGKIDILVGSYILKRGKNFPLMRHIINAGGGDSAGNVLQILGRAMRAHESKEETTMDDFWDIGAYLKRHSKHRTKVYKDERLPVTEVYKDALKKK